MFSSVSCCVSAGCSSSSVSVAPQLQNNTGVIFLLLAGIKRDDLASTPSAPVTTCAARRGQLLLVSQVSAIEIHIFSPGPGLKLEAFSSQPARSYLVLGFCYCTAEEIQQICGLPLLPCVLVGKDVYSYTAASVLCHHGG